MNFASPDGTKLVYHVRGTGKPVVCLPGGPMQDSDYLGDLGGLADRVQLILLDPRGTGESATPADPASYRCDRQVDDVEALRERLGLETMNLLAHSGGTNLALLYAARYPARIGTLVLVCPSSYATGRAVTAGERRAVVRLRAGEPWFDTTSAAFERVATGAAVAGDFAALAPLSYGRWDTEAQAHHARGEARRNNEAAAMFGADGAFDPPATRAALAGMSVPVLLLAGEYDVNSPPPVVAELASLFPNATLVTLPAAAHLPWLDDPGRFTGSITSFLSNATTPVPPEAAPRP